MITILYAHPYEKSFNHAILETITDKLAARGKEFEVIDLYADGFNPAFEGKDLSVYNEGRSKDPLVNKYIDILLRTESFIMIFPIWWSTMPAIVDGFFDKTMLAGIAFKYSDKGLVPDKFKIKHTLMFSTSSAPSEQFRSFFEDYFPPRVLATIGMEGVEWHNCQFVDSCAPEDRKAFLELVAKKVDWLVRSGASQ